MSTSTQLAVNEEYVFEGLEHRATYTVTATRSDQSGGATSQVISATTYSTPLLLAAEDNFYEIDLDRADYSSIESGSSRQVWMLTYTIFELSVFAPDDYRFEFLIPIDTGFQRDKSYSDGCSWNYTQPEGIVLMGPSTQIGLLRCSVGEENAEIEMRAWTAGVVKPWTYYRFKVAQGRHRGSSTIKYATSASMLGSTSTADLVNEAVSVAVSGWNDSSAGVTFCKDGETACNDYNAGHGTVIVRVGDCGNLRALACLPPGATYPHNIDTPVVIVESPCIENVCYTWSNMPRMVMTEPSHWYLPVVVMHELGHSAGLGHSSRGGYIDIDIMIHSYRRETPLSTYDAAAMRSVLNTLHPHPHPSGE